MAIQNHFVLFISRLIAPIAAKHGAHNKLNTMNEYAAKGVKLADNCPQNSFPSSATSAKPYNCPNVATTFSFAIKPVTLATAAFQSPQPSGEKIHANVCPIEDRIE